MKKQKEKREKRKRKIEQEWKLFDEILLFRNIGCEYLCLTQLLNLKICKKIKKFEYLRSKKWGIFFFIDNLPRSPTSWAIYIYIL